MGGKEECVRWGEWRGEGGDNCREKFLSVCLLLPYKKNRLQYLSLLYQANISIRLYLEWS